MARTQEVAPPPARLLTRAHLPLAVGAVALETLGAFENRAVGTTLPTMVRHFHAVGSFGLANAAPMVTYLVLLAVAGGWADRRGPGPVLRTGVLVFVSAQLLVGGAVGMPMVVLGRLLSGVAEGLLDVSLLVLVARALPAELRPRIFALFSAMWILPSVLGPPVAGAVTQYASWRWVFLGAVVLVVPTWLALRPALRDAAEAEPAEPRQEQVRATALWSAGAAAAVLALTLLADHLWALPLTVAAAAALAVCAARLLPTGTFRAARGIPAVILLRAVLGASFAATGGYLPLLLTVVRGFGATTAGVSLSITGVSWAFGSWLQGRDRSRGRVRLLRWGFTALTAGLAGTTLLAVTALPAGLGLACWALAGTGMGLSASTLSVLTMNLSPDNAQGRNASAVQAASSLSIATAYAVGGTALAAGSAGPAVFLAILAGATAVAAFGLAMTRRVTASWGTAPLVGGEQ